MPDTPANRSEEAPRRPRRPEPSPPNPEGDADTPTLIRRFAERFDDLETVDLEPLLARIGDARVVLLGEASHGTSEFYRMRARITRALIERKGFDVVALEADWPDAAQIDVDVRGLAPRPDAWAAFARFPRWMWRNEEMLHFVHWLRAHNQTISDPARRVGVAGLDLYSLYASSAAVLSYLEDVDPERAEVARRRYGCLSPFEFDPTAYGAAVLHGRHRACEADVVATLTELMRERAPGPGDGHALFDARANARAVADAEAYYRTMYYGGVASWNLRDRHMFGILQAILEFRGPASKVAVWEHNSHLGDARFTEMSARGELNVGQLCREAFGRDVYAIGFGTHTGTVAAASWWDGPVQIKAVRPSHVGSHEIAFHRSDVGRAFVPLRDAPPSLRSRLAEDKLERAIGVVYRPETERQSHYFAASLSRQFDEWCWFDESNAVTPLDGETLEGVPDTYPFGT